MLRLMSANDGAMEDPQLPAVMRAIISTINKTIGMDLDALAAHSVARFLAMEGRLAAIEDRVSIVEAQRMPRHLNGYRLKRSGLPDMFLDDIERRLADGIELDVIADGYAMTVDDIAHQLMARADRIRWRAGTDPRS